MPADEPVLIRYAAGVPVAGDLPVQATRLAMDDLSYYLGRLVCSLGLHSCEDTEAQLSVGHITFWVLIGLIGVGAWRFRAR